MRLCGAPGFGVTSVPEQVSRKGRINVLGQAGYRTPDLQ